MNRYRLLFCLLFSVVTVASGQKKKNVLMTIAGKEISSSEFKRVYNKNLNLVQDESQKNVDGYIDLFIDYKLKVAEAYAQDLHETSAYKKEFGKYQDQLSRKYIYEDRVTEEIAREAFERGLEEVDVDHILVRSNFNDSPSDTLIAYNKLQEVREKALAGEDFNELAAQFSEEPGADKRKGKLGYFSAFDMVYPFESMAFKTKVGDVSEIFRTSFGYHFLKVNDRRQRAAKISVSHIMISDNKEARTFDPKERIEEISALLKQGASFESLAKEYSDDKNSAKKGGQLRPFSKGSLRSKLFEKAAYEMENLGDVSEPFRSEFGWHIVRLDKIHDIPTFEDEKEQLERQVKEGNRSKLVTSAINKKIIEKYGFEKHESYKPFFESFVGEELFDRKWVYTKISGADNKKLFTIGKRTVSFDDFAKFIEERQRRSKIVKNKKVMLEDYYEEFEDTCIKDYFKEQLELENDEYAAVINEYRDGLLIFDVMQNNVWDKARLDSIGLADFYESRKNDYTWKQRVEAAVISSSNQEIANQAKSLLDKGEGIDAIKKALNANDKINVLISEGTFEIGQRELPTGFQAKTGVSEIFQEETSFKVVKVNKILSPSVKTLEEVRGRVLSEYQGFLEKKWMDDLRKKYKVDFNKKVLKKVKKELDS